MVYLIGPRLHFAGRFNANVATGNNTATNYSGGTPNPSFNFPGSGAWWVNDVTITRAVYGDGSTATSAAADPAVGSLLQENGRGRIVDLDPEQQLVSELYGLRLGLVPGLGEDSIFAGVFDVTSFRDIWWSRGAGGGDRAASASYQSELIGVNWGANTIDSRLLDELETATAPGRLSIKFVLDGFFAQGNLTGRIVGTIGSAVAGEPVHHVRGRHMGLLTLQNVNDQALDGPIWYMPAVVDRQRGKLIADFGNSLETTSSGDEIDTTVHYELGVSVAGQFTSYGVIPAQGGTWYEETAGICEFPADRAFTQAELDVLENNPLVAVASGNHANRVCWEDATGLYVTTDRHAFRLSAGEPAQASLHATRFGKVAANIDIELDLDSNGFRKVFADAVASDVAFPVSVRTNSDGIAQFTITAGTVNTPRGGLDGQICGIRWYFPQADPQLSIFTPEDFFSVLVWTDYKVTGEPNWNEHIERILGQYGTLYPVMKNQPGGVDLAAYNSVVSKKAPIKQLMGLSVLDPAHMPVTRDLSPAKRDAILAWLDTTGNNGNPNLGPPVGPSPLEAPMSLPDSKTQAIRARRGPKLK